ncbi:MAG: DUF2142 domain-containing protein, partial [Streptococcaceae bacterium]|nr:DUF2142 domain-containing protein [Streptococcaceae bacterium]
AFYIVISYFAVKKAKFGQYLLAAVALLPITIQQVASLSYDVFFFLSIFCAFSYATNLWTRKEPLKLKDWLILLGLSVFLYISKASAISMILLFAILPTALLGENFFAKWLETFWQFWKKHKILASVGLTLIGLAITAVGFRNYGGLSAGLQIIFNTFGRPDINPQLDPLVTDGMIGNFSWFIFKLPSWLIMLNFAFLGLLSFYDKDIQLDTRVPVSSVIIFVVNLIVTGFVLFSTWTVASLQKADTSWIEGLQGRYYTPFLVLLSPIGVYLSKYFKISITQNHLKKLFIFVTSFTLIYSLVLFVLYFYFYDGGRMVIPTIWQKIRDMFI